MKSYDTNVNVASYRQHGILVHFNQDTTASTGELHVLDLALGP